jgi:hypothetical protein
MVCCRSGGNKVAAFHKKKNRKTKKKAVQKIGSSWNWKLDGRLQKKDKE